MHGPWKEGLAKPVRGKAGQEGGCVKTMPGQSSVASAEVAKQGAETPTQRNWVWVEAEVWTDRMLSALVTASKERVPPSRMPNGSHFTPLGNSGTLPMMRKPPTGEPYAGKPPVRFGGRGG